MCYRSRGPRPHNATLSSLRHHGAAALEGGTERNAALHLAAPFKGFQPLHICVCARVFKSADVERKTKRHKNAVELSSLLEAIYYGRVHQGSSVAAVTQQRLILGARTQDSAKKFFAEGAMSECRRGQVDSCRVSSARQAT